MENKIIKKSDRWPMVSIDYDNAIIKMEGICVPEDPVEFFKPILDSVNKIIDLKKDITFDIFLEYFNTSSSKIILDLFVHVVKQKNNGVNSRVIWTYEQDDEELLDAGELMQEISKIDMEIKELS